MKFHFVKVRIHSKTDQSPIKPWKLLGYFGKRNLAVILCHCEGTGKLGLAESQSCRVHQWKTKWQKEVRALAQGWRCISKTRPLPAPGPQWMYYRYWVNMCRDFLLLSTTLGPDVRKCSTLGTPGLKVRTVTKTWVSILLLIALPLLSADQHKSQLCCREPGPSILKIHITFLWPAVTFLLPCNRKSLSTRPISIARKALKSRKIIARNHRICVLAVIILLIK